jgi:hypothetical protein
MTNEEMADKIGELETDLREAKARAALAVEQLKALALAIQRNEAAEIDKVINNLEHHGVW